MTQYTITLERGVSSTTATGPTKRDLYRIDIDNGSWDSYHATREGAERRIAQIKEQSQ